MSVVVSVGPSGERIFDFCRSKKELREAVFSVARASRCTNVTNDTPSSENEVLTPTVAVVGTIKSAELMSLLNE
jgi:hypothetical protein